MNNSSLFCRCSFSSSGRHHLLLQTILNTSNSPSMFHISLCTSGMLIILCKIWHKTANSMCIFAYKKCTPSASKYVLALCDGACSVHYHKVRNWLSSSLVCKDHEVPGDVLIYFSMVTWSTVHFVSLKILLLKTRHSRPDVRDFFLGTASPNVNLSRRLIWSTCSISTMWQEIRQIWSW